MPRHPCSFRSRGPHPLQRPRSPRPEGAPHPCLLQRCARWPRARMPRAAAATAAAAALAVRPAAPAAAAAAPGPGEVRGAPEPGSGWPGGWGSVGGGVGSACAPPQMPPSASSILLRARGGGRARWAWWVGWRGAGPSGEPLPGRSLTCSAQPRWRLCRSTPSWLAVELTIGVRETVYLGCAYFGEFGNEPKSENKFVPNQQLLSAAQRRIRLLGCVCGAGERGVI